MNSTILLIDDNLTLRENMIALLQAANYQVREADSYSEAIAILRREEIHLVLSDLVLVGESGIDLLNYIRQQHTDKTLPFILFSGYNLRRAISDELKFKPNLFFQKPFSVPALLNGISDLLNNHSAI